MRRAFLATSTAGAAGAIAFLLARRFATMLLLSVMLSAVIAFLGVYLSFFIDSAPAPTIVLLFSIVFGIAFVVSNRRTARREADATP